MKSVRYFFLLSMMISCSSLGTLSREVAQERSGAEEQRLYWQAVDQDRYEEADRLEKVLLQTLRYSPPESLDRYYKPGQAWLVTFPNGVLAVFKPVTDVSYPAPEIEAHQIDKLLRFLLTPPIVVRELEGRMGSLQLFVNDAVEAKIDLRLPNTPYPNDRLYVFDHLIGNLDRNGGNWMIRRGGRVVAIDNSVTWSHQDHEIPKQSGPYASDEQRVLSFDTYEKLLAFMPLLQGSPLDRVSITMRVKAQQRAEKLIAYNNKNMPIGGGVIPPANLCRELFSR